MSEPVAPPTGDRETRTRTAAGLAGLVALALLLRAIRWWRAGAIGNDGPLYLDMAERMMRGDWRGALAFDYHPLYSALIALARPLARDTETAAAAVSCLAGGVAVVALWFFLRDAFDRRIAWVGAALLAVHGHAVRFTAEVQTEGTYLALFVAATAVLWKAYRTQHIAPAFAAGALAGLAYLTRPEGLGVALVGFALAAHTWIRGDWPLRSAVRWCAALGIGVMLASAPYVAYLTHDTGELTFTRKKSVTGVLGVDELLEGARLAPAATPSPERHDPVSAFVPDAPVRAASIADGAMRYLGGVLHVLGDAASSARPEIVVFLLLGLVRLRGPMGNRGRFLLAFALLYGFVLTGLYLHAGYVSRRHSLPILVLLLGYAAAGVPVFGSGLVAAARRVIQRPGPVSPGLALAVGLAVALSLGIGKSIRPTRERAVAERQAAQWLRDVRSDGDRVGGTKRRIGYYADMPFFHIHLERDADVLLDVLRKHHVRWVVIDEEDTHVLQRSAEGEPRAIRLAHRAHADGYTVFVYELIPSERKVTP